MNTITKACLEVINDNATKKTCSQYQNNKLRDFTYVNNVRFDTKKFNIAMIAVRDTLVLKVNDYPTRKFLTEKLIDTKKRIKQANEQLEGLLDSVLGLKTLEENLNELDETPLGTPSPTETVLRYIIWYNRDTERHVFYFANRHTSHYELNEHRINTMEDHMYSSATGGGFYARTQDGIVLFGESDTYGLEEEVYRDAISNYEETIGGEDCPKRFREVLDRTVFYKDDEYDDDLPF